MTFTTAAQASVDEEITKHMLSICSLRTQRNAVSLIGHLPPEMLEIVFIQCASDHYDSRGSGYPTRNLPSWVGVSHVCRYWRSVSLNCPTLWSYLFAASQRWTEELLVRSKQASLKIRLTVWSPNIDPWRFHLVEQVLNHSERIQECCLKMPCTWGSKFSAPAPRLQKLRLSISSELRHNHDANSEWPLLFGGDTPVLNTLELRNCPLAWYLFKLSRLTILCLHDVPVRFRQNMDELLATLCCMQGLQHLYLDDVLTSVGRSLSSAMSNTIHGVDLPHLSRLLITAPLSTVVTLLSCINCPSKTELRLKFSPPHENDWLSSDPATLGLLLAQRFNISTTIRSLVIDSPAWKQVKLAFSGMERDCNSFYHISGEEWDLNIPLRIVLHFSESIGLDDRIRNTTNICRSMPLTHVQSVHVIRPPFSQDFWRRTLGHVRDLRCIKLSEGDMPDLASLLSPQNPTSHKGTENQSGDADQVPDGIFAPVLEELVIHHISFPVGQRCDTIRHAAIAQPLYDALSARKNRQIRLTMTRCCVIGMFCKYFDLVAELKGGRFHILECNPAEAY